MSQQQSAILSQLLPYETDSRKNGSLQTGLKEYQTLLRALHEATLYMQASDLERFDSLVGENACQIRAVWLAILASKGPFNLVRLQNQITNVLSKVAALLAPKTIASLMRGNESLKTVLEKENLDISLIPEELFMIKSYLLTEMKTVVSAHEKIASLCRIESGDPKKLQRLGDISTSFARNLLSKVRRMLATSSVQFVRNYACANQNPSLKRMVSEEFTTEQNTLPCIPMFWTYKTVLAAAQEEKIPLILHVKFLEKTPEGFSVIDEEYLYFKTAHNGSYAPTQPNEFDLDKPACVIQGIATAGENGRILTKSKWKASIEENGVIDVILAGAADHRQFPNPELDQLFHGLNDCEYENYKSHAKREGFSFKNPTTFFIQHVYAAIVGDILRKMTIKNSKRSIVEEFLTTLQRECMHLRNPNAKPLTASLMEIS